MCGKYSALQACVHYLSLTASSMSGVHYLSLAASSMSINGKIKRYRNNSLLIMQCVETFDNNLMLCRWTELRACHHGPFDLIFFITVQTSLNANGSNYQGKTYFIFNAVPVSHLLDYLPGSSWLWLWRARTGSVLSQWRGGWSTWRPCCMMRGSSILTMVRTGREN